MRAKHRLAVLALVALVGSGSISVAQAPGSLESTAARIKPLPLREPCLRRGERSQVVRFRAADGTRLLGVVFGRGRSGVVLSHGLRGDLCSWVPQARRLAARGYRVLAFDSRGHGSSASRGGALRWRVDLDAAAAARELRRRGAASVVLAGSSLGAIAVLGAAADVSPPVSGVISLSAPRSFVLMDAERAVRRLQVPVLFAAGEFDDPFQEDARALYAATASSERRLEILPGSGDHGSRLLRNAPMRAAFDSFLAAHSAGPTSQSLANTARRPKPLQLREKCLRRAERSQVVRFRAADGTRLLGVLFGRGQSGVVLSHGLNNDLCSWAPYARTLTARGFRVLAFDSRGHGSSATRGGALRWRMDLDVAGAVRELRRRGATSVLLAGSSLGATAVLVAAADVSPLVAGVVSLSAPRSFVVLDAEAAARRLQVPVLFAVAEFDGTLPEDARAMYEAAASSERRLELLPGSRDHGTRLLRNPQVRGAVDAFLAAHSAR